MKSKMTNRNKTFWIIAILPTAQFTKSLQMVRGTAKKDPFPANSRERVDVGQINGGQPG